MPLDLKKLEALTKLEPNNPKHWFYLGAYYFSIKDIAQAYKALETAVKINPYFAQAQFFIGFIVIYNREFKTGLKYLEKAYTIDEKVFLKIKSDYEIEKILDELIKGSIKVIQDQIEINPNNLENLYLMGRILFYIQNYESAINYFRKIIELKPDNWEVYIYLALSYKELNNYENAINYLKKSILINNYYPDSYWLLGEIYIDMGNYGLALKNLERAVELAPNNSRYLNSLARVYLELDKIPQAIRTLQISIDSNPNSKWSYFYLGKALEKEFNFELAIEQYLKALEIDPNFIEAKYSLAKLYSYFNDYTKAIDILENITDKIADPEVYFMLGQFYYNIDNYEKAIYNLENYVKILNNNWQAFYLLYLNYIKINNKEKALFYLEKAFELNSKDTKIIVDLFKIYVDLRQIQKAEKFLDIIKNLVKDVEIIKRIIFIYFEKKDYENAFYVFFENKLYNDINYLFDLITFIKNKDREIYLSFLSKVLNFIDCNQNKEICLELQIEYLERVYEVNTLQAYEYFNSKVGFQFLDILANIQNSQDIINNRFNLILFNLLLIYLKIIFTLYVEYKSEDYLRKYISITEKIKTFSFLFVKEYDNINLNSGFINFVINNFGNKDVLSGSILFYLLILNLNFIYVVLVFKDYIFNKKDIINFKNPVIIKIFEDIIPLLIENEINDIALDFIDLFINFNYPVFLRYKIDILDLENKPREVIDNIQKYYDSFFYESYLELIRLKNLINLDELKEVVKEDLEKLILEFNPLAMALYANIIIFENKNEAIRLLDKAFEIIIEDKFKFQYNYQLISTVVYLSKIYSKYFSIYKLIKYLNELSRKFSDNYRINYLLAYYLYLTEDFVDAEVIAKRLIKLAKTNNLLIEAQKLLATIKTERENYNNFLLTLENLFKGISITITSYLNLIKKGKIEEVLKYIETLNDDTKIENIIIKAILYDKLEIYQYFIYYYNLFKIWALDKNLDNLIDLIDKKLYNYSEFSDFEELKIKAQITYASLFKKEAYIQTNLEEKTEKIENKIEQNILIQEKSKELETQIEQIKQIENIENLENLEQQLTEFNENKEFVDYQLDNNQLLDIDNIQLDLDSFEEGLKNQKEIEENLEVEEKIRNQNIIEKQIEEQKKIQDKVELEEQENIQTQNVQKQEMMERIVKIQDKNEIIEKKEIQEQIKTQEKLEIKEQENIEEQIQIEKPRETEESSKEKENINKQEETEIQKEIEHQEKIEKQKEIEKQEDTKKYEIIEAQEITKDEEQELMETYEEQNTTEISISVQEDIIEKELVNITKENIFDKSLNSLFLSDDIDKNTIKLYLSNIDKLKLSDLDDIIIVNIFYMIYLLKLHNKLDLDELIDSIDFSVFVEKRDEFVKQNLSLKEFFNAVIDIESNIFDIKAILIKIKELMAKFKNNIYYFSFFLIVLSLVYLSLNKINEYKKYFQITLNNFKETNKIMFNFLSFLDNIIINSIKDYVN